MERRAIRFVSGGAECAAWHYPGTNAGCVVMGAGMAVTKEPGTDRFAARFAEAGFTVLAFDPRGFGESGGRPRQVLRIPDQLQDWDAALALARTLPGVDPGRIAAWGFSLAGGHVLRVATKNRTVAAVIAQTPLVDSMAAARSELRHQRPAAALRLLGIGVWDAVGGLAGRPPRLVPLGGEPGTVAMLTSPDGLAGAGALDPEGRYPCWQQAVAARSALALGRYRPARVAPEVPCPLLVVVADQDTAAPAEAAVRVARRAPLGELLEISGGHYAPFLDAHEVVVTAELAFLRRHLLPHPS
jgi:pimeloyl-ACP methyl ester carboxylesterase